MSRRPLLMRKTSSPLNTFLDLREITGDTLCLAVPGRPDERAYQAVISVSTIDFPLMDENEQEAVLEGFRAFLSRLTFEIAIHIKIKPYNLRPYIEQVEAAARSGSDLLADLAADHRTFVLSLASQRALQQRSFYIHVPADEPVASQTRSRQTLAETFDAARSQLDQRVADLISDLERMGLTARRLTNLELANYYTLHEESNQKYPLTAANLEAAQFPIVASGQREDSCATVRPTTQGKEHKDEPPKDKVRFGPKVRLDTLRCLLSSKRRRHQVKQFSSADYPDMIHISDLISPSSLEVERTYVRVHQVTDEYIRCFSVVGYPRQVVPGWLDRLISIDEPYLELSLRIKPLDAAHYISKLSRKIISLRGTMRVDQQRGRTSDPYLEAGLEDVTRLRDKLVRKEEQVFGVSLYLMVRARTKRQLEERTQRLYSQLGSLRAVPLTMQHDKGLLSMLPGPDRLKRQRVLDTSSLVTAYPFCDSALATPTGTLRGVTSRGGNLVIMDEFSDALENANEVKFAKSGSGKSYDSKVRIMRSLMAGIKVSVIDPENEYRLAKHLHGQIISLTASSLQMNPFEIPWRTGEEQEEKYQSLLALFDLLMAEKKEGMLSQFEKAYLTRVLGWLYSSADLQPCMRTFHEGLRREIAGPDSFGLAERLERFVTIFPEQTKITLENPLTIFNIRDLDGDLKGVGLFLVAEHIWTQMRRSPKPVPHLLLIDEAWSLLQHPAGGQFLAGIARRARKYYLALSVVTQDVEDFLGSEHGRTILTNSSIKFLLKQDYASIDAVSKAFKLSESERKFLLGARKGEGLYFAKGVHVPMQVIASPLEHQLATTYR